MQKLEVKAGNYQRHTRQNQNIPTEAGLYVPLPECPVCQGFGKVHPRNLDGSPDYSRTIVCPAPGCMLESTQAYKNREDATNRWQQSGIHSQSQTFDNFKLIKGVKSAFKYASDIALGEANFVWLLIYGGVGNGKTHLCNAIAKASLDRGVAVIMLNSAGMYSQIKAAMDSHTDQELITKFKEVALLIIDDWGVEYGTDWQLAVFDEILDARYWTARATVVTTNKDIAELPARIKSRFSDKKIARVAYNSAPDYRKTR